MPTHTLHPRAEGLFVKTVRWLEVVLLVLSGLALVVGGFELLRHGGHAIYLLFGLGFIVSAVLLARRSVWGAVLLAVIAVVAMVWALVEADGNRWALIPRLGMPIGFAAVALLLMPWLEGVRRRVSWGSAAALLGVTAVLPMLLPDNSTTHDALLAEAAARAPDVPIPANTLDADWPAYGGTTGSRRFTTLAAITPENVAELDRAWVFNTGSLPENVVGGTNKQKQKFAAETTPLKINDHLYLCTALNQVIALDPGTGAQRWRYDPKVDPAFIPYSAACRGVSYHESAPAIDPGVASPISVIEKNRLDETLDVETTVERPNAACAQRIIAPTLDGRILALDANSGLPCKGFGLNGEIDITDGMGDVLPGMVAITSPLIIVNGVIVTNHQVKDNVDIDAPSGVIQGFDVTTGELVWAWDMDRPDRVGRPVAPDEYTRGTPNSWTIASADPELGLVYIPMGNSAGDYISYERSEAERRYGTALVALDVATGRPRWHFQTVHNDVWDYDLGSQASLIDFPTDAGPVPALILPSKQGDMFVLDRATGKPLVDVEERAVPQGGVEPQLRSPTQPFSTYHTVAQPKMEPRDMWGMTLLDQLWCRRQFQRASYEGIYTPPTAKQPWIQYPGYNGGSDWGGIAIDPVRGLIITNYNDLPNYNRLLTKDREISGGGGGEMGPMKGAVYGISVNAGFRNKATELICKEPPYGGIRAVDVASGETVWDRPLGSARANGPWGIPSKLPARIGTPNNGGSVLTGSGLTFIAAATDNRLTAIETATGEELWSDVLPGGGQANPMSYEHEGRQYVLIMAGGHHFMRTPISDALVAYALPERP